MDYVAVASSQVAASILWAWVYNYDYGLFNSIIKLLTGHHGPNWLRDEFLVKVALIICMVWKGFGTSIILYLAGLQNIPRNYYEAASIDGANGWQKFRHITVPLVSPVTFYILITSLIGGFQVFVEVQVMTNKGGTNYSAATVVLVLIHISDPTRLRRNSYAVFCLKKKIENKKNRVKLNTRQKSKVDR